MSHDQNENVIVVIKFDADTHVSILFRQAGARRGFNSKHAS